MLTTVRTALLLLAAGWKRFLSCVMLIALLSVAAGLLGVAALSGEETENPLNVVIVNKDDSMGTRFLLSAILAENDSGYLRLHSETEARAERMLSEGSASAVFVLPERFLHSVMSGENAPIAAVYNPGTPVRALLARSLADTLLQLLSAAQSGVYTGLSYAEQHTPEKYETVFERLNMRYIGLVLAHESVFRTELALATGELDIGTHYTLHVLIFLQMLCIAAICPLVRNGFSRAMIRGLRLRGRSAAHTAVSWSLALWSWLTAALFLLAALYAGAAGPLPLPEHAAALVVLPVVSLLFATMTALFAFLFDRGVLDGVLICVYASASLLLSGGVIPLSFLPDLFSRLARLTPSWWLASLMGGALHGSVRPDALIAVLCHALLYFTLCWRCVFQKGKAVCRL